ncbi:MAG TPA: hypothetical protein VJJ21_03340 [Candidatus Nanoarchaeia archaeon]|nr:hypothetical protein [Candidatus Nanoarchaeia archaeon]
MSTRIPPSTLQRILAIKREKDPRRALEGIVDLFTNYYPEEEKIPVLYDQKSGKPTRYRFEPRSYCNFGHESGSWFEGFHFRPRIYLGGSGYTDPEPKDPGLAENIVSMIQFEGPILIELDSGRYVFSYETIIDTGDERPSHRSAPESLIMVMKVKELRMMKVKELKGQ